LALDREETLKKAEKLLRQGRLDAAIAEYVRVVEDQPKDWNTANTLGDLYMRAAETPSAVAQFARIAEHFLREGFYPKAGALFKKILKISPDDESAQMHLAEISAKQGLLADAKSYFGAVAARRRSRGDHRGADEIVMRLGDLDPGDFEARSAAARIVAQSGDGHAAAGRFRQIYDDLIERGRKAGALEALREAVRFNPGDTAGLVLLAADAIAAGDPDRARAYLDRDPADPRLLLALADIELRAGLLQRARDVLAKLLALDRGLRDRVIELAWKLTSTGPDAAGAMRWSRPRLPRPTLSTPHRFCKNTSRGFRIRFRRCCGSSKSAWMAGCKARCSRRRPSSPTPTSTLDSRQKRGLLQRIWSRESHGSRRTSSGFENRS
jgi:Flp pilus assembly protein TadD